MSISSNDSSVYTPTTDGSYGPGWVWGGGDAGWVYQGGNDEGGAQDSSALTQTLLAGLQQQSEPPQDWFARANSMAMAAMVAAQTSSSGSVATTTITQEKFLQSGASMAFLQQSAGVSTTATTPTAYTIQASDIASSNPWAAITQTLYGTTDVSVVQALQAAMGSPALVVGQLLTPPETLSYSQSTDASVTLNQNVLGSMSQNTVVSHALNTTSALLSTTALQPQTKTRIDNPLTPSPGSWSSTTTVGSSATAVFGVNTYQAPNGDGVTVWLQDSNLLARRYDKATQSWGAAVVLDGAAVGGIGAESLSVGFSGNGNVAVSWLQDGKLYARRFVAGAWEALATNGKPAFEIPYSSSAPVSVESIAINDSGRVVLAYTQNSNLYVYTHNGNAWSGSPQNIDDIGAYNPNFVYSNPNPLIEMDASGNAMLLWRQVEPNGGAESLTFSRYDAATGVWTAPNSTALENSSIPVLGYNFKLDANGNGMAVWSQFVADAGAGTTYVYASRYTRSTNQWSPATYIGTELPQVALSANGNGVLAWQTSSQRINVWRFDQSGWLTAAPVDIAPSVTAKQRLMSSQAVAINDSGRVVVNSHIEQQINGGTVYSPYLNVFDGSTWALIDTNRQSDTVSIDSAGTIQTVWSTKTNPYSYYPDAIQTRHYNVGARGYQVPVNATWEAVTHTLYGTSDAVAVAALKAQLGNPALTAGARLINLPATLSYSATVTVPAYYTVPAGGTTWAGIATAMYGSADVADELATTMGNVALTAGTQLNLPAKLDNTVLTSVQGYVVPANPSWTTVAQALYHVSTAEAVNALKAALGNPTLTPGTLLAPPASLSYRQTVVRQVSVNQTVLTQSTPTSSSSNTNTTALGYTAVQPPAAAPVSGPTFGAGSGVVAGPAAPAALTPMQIAALAVQGYQVPFIPSGLSVAQAQQRVDELSSLASQQYTTLASARSAALFARQSADYWEQPVTSPPRERPQDQWNSISIVWYDRIDEPTILMDTMRGYGFDARDIAYATGQSWAAVGQYLVANGADEGFAGWSQRDYASIQATALRTQIEWNQASTAREQTLSELKNAQAVLLALIQGATPSLYAAPGTASGAAPAFPAASGTAIDKTSIPSTFPDDQVRISPPRVRSMGQWQGIKLVWEDRKDEPQVLMQFMRDYGVDAADIAYATEQSVQTIGQYLRTHGAADGFAGWRGGSGSRGGSYFNPTSNASNAASGTPYATNSHGIFISRVPPSDTSPLIVPPNERPMSQWESIKIVWQDRVDEPQVLMQAMRDYGFDAADIAYATGQSVAAVAQFLRANGAADGFANWSDAGGYYNPNTPHSLPEPYYRAVSSTPSTKVPAQVSPVHANTQILTTPPRERPAQQWADIKAVWLDRQDEPYRLMQTMVEFGFDAADIAYASGQSLDAVSVYLSRAGAPVGFAGADIIDRDAVNQAYLAALDEVASTGHGAGWIGGAPVQTNVPLVDTNAFTHWYVQQDNRWAHDFLRLYGPQFSQLSATVSAGRWSRGTNQAAQPTWVASRLVMNPRVEQVHAQIKHFLSIPPVDTIERNIMRLQFSNEVNQEVLRLYGKPVSLPENEMTERLRARYGSELTGQMLQLRNAVLDAAMAVFDDNFWLEAKAAENDSRFMVYADAIGNGSVGEYNPGYKVPQFSLRLFADSYMTTHDSSAIRLYNRMAEVYGWGPNLPAVTESGIWTLNLERPEELIDPNLVSYSPVWGFYTFRENLKEPKPGWFETVVPVVLIGVIAWHLAPYAATAVGAGGNLIVTAGFAGAFVTAGTSLLTTGNIKFKDVLRSAITAMLTAGFAQQTGLDRLGYELPDGSIQYVNNVPVVQSYLLRSMAVLGMSTFKGLLSEITGGGFGPAFRQGLADGLAREVLNSINVQINQQSGLSDFERGSYQMFARSLSAAIRAAADPNDPAHAFAVDFLNQVATSLPDTPAINLPPTNRVAFDDEGNLMPGIVDFSLPPAQQRQQLYNQLIQQGMSPQDAQNLTVHYFTMGDVAGWSGVSPGTGSGTGSSGSSTPPVSNPVPTATEATDGLILLNDERFNQLINSMVQAGDEAGLQALAALMEGEANRATSSANGLGTFAQAQYLLMLQRAGQINQALQGLAIPGLQPPDPTDPLWQGLPTSNGTTINWRDLVNIQPANWPDWAKNLLVRLQISAQELMNYLPLTTLPIAITTAADLIIDKKNSEILGNNLTAGGTHMPAPGYDAHHIVPSGVKDADMQALRDRLTAWGIDLNSANNGVWLPGWRSAPGSPGAYHPRLNNGDYNEAVINAFQNVTTPQGAINTLRIIGNQLRNDTFPGSRPRP